METKALIAELRRNINLSQDEFAAKLHVVLNRCAVVRGIPVYGIILPEEILSGKDVFYYGQLLSANEV